MWNHLNQNIYLIVDNVLDGISNRMRVIQVYLEKCNKCKKEGSKIIFKGITDGNIEEVCNQYFDLDRDYKQIKLKLSAIDDNMKASIQYGQGIRLLNQDLWETIISFIISANNNIPRIKGIIEKSVKHMEKK